MATNLRQQSAELISELSDALEEALNSVLCFCGNHKRMGKAFCFQCFDLLPAYWQTDLKRQVNANTYDAAHEWLITRRNL